MNMRIGLIDQLFMIATIVIGALLGRLLAPHVSQPLQLLVQALCVASLYLALMYPFYRGLKLVPMILPRCPCCGNFQKGFYFLEVQWPRITFRCPSCNGEFVIWHNGTPGDQETWEKPVLALKWPYALGTYKRMSKPDPGDAPPARPSTPVGNPGVVDGPPPMG